MRLEIIKSSVQMNHGHPDTIQLLITWMEDRQQVRLREMSIIIFMGIFHSTQSKLHLTVTHSGNLHYIYPSRRNKDTTQAEKIPKIGVCLKTVIFLILNLAAIGDQ